MGKTISRIEPAKPIEVRRKRVAAYARISIITDRLSHSLSAQVSNYSTLIQRHSEWEYAGVFVDNGLSGGSSENRREFQRMLDECEKGNIDIILTKSVSRFARNTVDTLSIVRHLKDIGIEVRFEKEGISSFSEDGELMLSLFASFAQEEIFSLSENVKWGTRKRFEKGIPNGHFQIYGYRWEGDHLVIHPEEARIVRLIYDNFLMGLSAETTEKQLEQMGVKSYKGKHFCNTSIRQILRNVTYTGNLLLQKEYVVDPLTGKSKINHGELPQYWVENTHEAIIPMEVYQAVQDEVLRRRELGARANWSINTSCFTSMIKCPHCNRSYVRSHCSTKKRVSDTWVCGTRKEKKTGDGCPVKGSINHAKMVEACTEVLGLGEFDESVFLEKIDHIEVPESQTLTFFMKDGTSVTRACLNTGHQDCWTPELRAACSKSRMGKNPRVNDHNPFTGSLRCPICGAFYRRQTKKYKDGTKRIYWHCPNSARCKNRARASEECIMRFSAEAMGIAEFDEATFHAQVDHIDFTGDYEATLHMKDGRMVVRTWEPEPRKTYPRSEELKKRMSELNKARWADEKYRQQASEKMKQIRREKHWSSRRKSPQSQQH